MKLYESILLSASVGFLIIGISQVFYGKFAESYWVLMFALICLLLLRLFRYREKQRNEALKSKEKSTQKQVKKVIGKKAKNK